MYPDIATKPAYQAFLDFGSHPLLSSRAKRTDTVSALGVGLGKGRGGERLPGCLATRLVCLVGHQRHDGKRG